MAEVYGWEESCNSDNSGDGRPERDIGRDENDEKDENDDEVEIDEPDGFGVEDLQEHASFADGVAATFEVACDDAFELDVTRIN